MLIEPIPNDNVTVPSSRRTRVSKWAYDNFMRIAKEMHGNRYNYTKVKPEHIKNAHSKIPIKCNICGYKWEPSIYHHLNDKDPRGCSRCSGKERWTLKRFKLAGARIHQDKYDYSEVISDHIQNKYSHVPVLCATMNGSRPSMITLMGNTVVQIVPGWLRGIFRAS